MRTGSNDASLVLGTVCHQLWIAHEELRKAQANVSALVPSSDPFRQRIEALNRETGLLHRTVSEALEVRPEMEQPKRSPP